MSDIIPADEIQRMTGYKRAADQLRELHLQGFYRARLAKVTGEVILERPHYDAVISGTFVRAPVVDISDVCTPRGKRTARPMDWNARTALYRHFDKKGVVLYIGIAVDPKARESAHRCYSEWKDKIHRIDVEWHPDRHAARAAERAAISAERPKFNILHKREPATC